MVSGDIVSGIFTTTSVYHSFQPALTVQIMITFMGGWGTIVYGGLTNGVTNAVSKLSDGADWSEGANVKCGINNTNYLVVNANSVAPSYSGIQIA